MSTYRRCFVLGVLLCAAFVVANRSHEATAQVAAPIRTVFVIVFENTSWSGIAGNAAAPYINSLLPQASHAERYFTPPGLHPSAPNYMWMEGGRDFGFAGGSTFSPYVNSQNTTNHLVTQLANAGISWKTYQESIGGGQCPLADVPGQYAVRHNPFVFFNDVTGGQNVNSPYCVAHVRPYSEFAGDLAQNAVARYNFIKPNLCHDMHDCGVAEGDEWLAAELPRILSSQAYQQGGVVFIAWDEGAGSTEDGPLGFIALSPAAKGGGYSNTIYYTHGSLLLTLQEIFGVGPLLGDAANATDLSDLFARFPPVTPSTPSPADAASAVSSNAMLKWSSSGGRDNVYFGASNPPPLVATGVSTRSYVPAPLTPGVQYYWQIVSNTTAGITNSPVWTFSVGATALPGSWNSADVGSVAAPGSASVLANTFTLRSSGVAGSADAFRYLYQPFGGDGDIVARITSLQPATGNGRVGLMLRDTLDPQSSYTMLDVRTDGVLEFSRRLSAGAASSSSEVASVVLPAWLRLSRRGSTVSAAASSDGVSWTTIANADVSNANGLPYGGIAATSGGCAVPVVATLDGVALTSSLPPGWTSQDIGNVGPPGSASSAGGVLTVQAAGADVWGAADSFNFTSQSLTGDGTIVARVTSLLNTNSFAKAGVMFRDSLAPGAVHVILDVRPGGGVEFMTRLSPDGPTTYVAGTTQGVPAWLKLTRSGSVFTGAVSADGVNWAAVGSASVAAMYASAAVGLAVTSHTTSTPTTATFTNVTVTSGSPPNPPSIPWTTQDIGLVGIGGTTSLAVNAMTVHAAGADIWGSTDSFTFTSTPAAGNGQIVVRVASLVNTNVFAKAGVMWRDTADAGAAHVILDARPDGGIEFMTRPVAGAPTTFLAGASRTLPVWLRLTRSGSIFSGDVSSDGSSWTPIGTTSLVLGTAASVGVAVTSHNTAVVTTASLDNVNVTTAPALPAPWTAQDIGAVGRTGSVTSPASGSFTVSAAGADVWGNADSFNYTSQPANGDVAITARVTGLQNTDAHAKAGVMFRETLAPGSTHIVLDVQPDGSVEFMTRSAPGAATTYLTGASQAFPAWVRLSRSGSIFTASASADGNTWRPVGTVGVSMAVNALVGLAVTSHSSSTPTTATFDSVSIR
jgi:regulation of enolase protein 1 (concanavalin A-like superfamily)